jgi:hypothetical protein
MFAGSLVHGGQLDMLSCERAASLSSERLDRDLTLRERFALGTHLLACRFCKQYASQLHFLRETSRRFDSRDPGVARLTIEAKKRMRERLKNP